MVPYNCLKPASFHALCPARRLTGKHCPYSLSLLLRFQVSSPMTSSLKSTAFHFWVKSSSSPPDLHPCFAQCVGEGDEVILQKCTTLGRVELCGTAENMRCYLLAFC